ncbi:IS630 family transposase [Rhodococcus wratislaviensis]|uniref:IS630 family transposase n=1 Tax=Rhodococcus wratislaviensis TaxID=44752 RepID=UPI0020D03DDA
MQHNPPEKAVVLCVEEKSGMQALDRSQPVLPMMPGVPERRSHDDVRSGVTGLFAAFNIADGTVISEIHRRHRAVESKRFLIAIDKAVSAELDVHLVCDNLATQKTSTIRAWLQRHPRFHLHFTPPGSSWINQLERWCGFLTGRTPTPWCPQKRCGTGGRRLRLDRKPEPRPQTVHLAQDRRRDSRLSLQIWRDFRTETLVPRPRVRAYPLPCSLTPEHATALPGGLNVWHRPASTKAGCVPSRPERSHGGSFGGRRSVILRRRPRRRNPRCGGRTVCSTVRESGALTPRFASRTSRDRPRSAISGSRTRRFLSGAGGGAFCRSASGPSVPRAGEGGRADRISCHRRSSERRVTASVQLGLMRGPAAYRRPDHAVFPPSTG